MYAALLVVSLCLTWLVSAYTPGERRSLSQVQLLQRDTAPVQQYTAPSAFPKSAFSAYYQEPSGTSVEPRPIIWDHDAGRAFPPSLDRPFPLPTGPPSSEAVFPEKKKGSQSPSPPDLASHIKSQIIDIISDTSLTECQRCTRALRAGQRLAHAEPRKVPSVLEELCNKYEYASTKSGLSQKQVCRRTYSASVLGAQYSQILSYADFTAGDASSDALYLCNQVVGSSISQCKAPAPIDLNANHFLDDWFGGARKRRKIKSKQSMGSLRSGPPHLNKAGTKQMMKVLHFSDIHVDPRFFIGGEARCTSGQCCRSDSFNSTVADRPPSPPGSQLPMTNISEAAVYWGNYHCDSPWPLAVSAMQSVTKLNGGKPVDMSIYTGDMVTHDSEWHISESIIRYTQQAIFDTMKRFLGDGPVFSAIGNHDTSPIDSASPHSLPDAGPRHFFSYDWKNLQRLFEAGRVVHPRRGQAGQHPLWRLLDLASQRTAGDLPQH